MPYHRKRERVLHEADARHVAGIKTENDLPLLRFERGEKGRVHVHEKLLLSGLPLQEAPAMAMFNVNGLRMNLSTLIRLSAILGVEIEEMSRKYERRGR